MGDKETTTELCRKCKGNKSKSNLKKSIVYLGKCDKCKSFLNLIIKMNVEVKAHTADIRSVVEFDLPGMGLTREYGLPCWEGTDTPLYGTWGVLERTDHSLRWRRR